MSLQTIANWRVRGVGPDPEPFGSYRGNRCYYRVDKVHVWLSANEGREVVPWKLWREYLSLIFPCLVEAPRTEIEEFIEQLEAHGVFTHVWARPSHRIRPEPKYAPVLRDRSTARIGSS